MKFRTTIPAPDYPFQITIDDRLFFMGSCFAEHLSAYFAERRFRVNNNPFGILFNPLSIAEALLLLTGEHLLTESCYQFFDGKWISFAHHGRFSHPDKSIFLQKINEELQQARVNLQRTDYLFITFGTAYYYFHKEKKMVVANCHKVPAVAFEKRRTDVVQVVEAFQPFFAWKKQHNPNLKVVFTVSPVRHLSDGFHENQVSKSVLHLAVEELLHTYGEFYFPSYEIFNDDLRDYRFYDKDLCHPSAQGIEYVQEIVSQSFFSEKTIQKIKEIEKENKRLQHKPLHNVDEK